MKHSWYGIGKLIEECGEVQQLLGKAIAYPEGPHPDKRGSIIDRLPEELADLQAAINYVIITNNLDSDFINQRKRTKLDKFLSWGLSGIKHEPENTTSSPSTSVS